MPTPTKPTKEEKGKAKLEETPPGTPTSENPLASVSSITLSQSPDGNNAFVDALDNFFNAPPGTSTSENPLASISSITLSQDLSPDGSNAFVDALDNFFNAPQVPSNPPQSENNLPADQSLALSPISPLSLLDSSDASDNNAISHALNAFSSQPSCCKRLDFDSDSTPPQSSVASSSLSVSTLTSSGLNPSANPNLGFSVSSITSNSQGGSSGFEGDVSSESNDNIVPDFSNSDSENHGVEPQMVAPALAAPPAAPALLLAAAPPGYATPPDQIVPCHIGLAPFYPHFRIQILKIMK